MKEQRILVLKNKIEAMLTYCLRTIIEFAQIQINIRRKKRENDCHLNTEKNTRITIFLTAYLFA